MPAIVFEQVTKAYPHHGGQQLLRDRLLGVFGRRRAETFEALKEISLSIDAGEGVALIGPNGAGKSTLLSLAAGLTRPTRGAVLVSGRVAPLLELGSGFHPDLTGAENLRINAALMGLSRRQTAEQFAWIVDFSGLREFIHEPLRTYSAGMVLRLGFAVAICVEPDVLVADEMLGVGDQAFYQQCVAKVLEFRRHGKTILFASHAEELVRMLSDRAIWLDHGRVVLAGPTAEVQAAYLESLNARPSAAATS